MGVIVDTSTLITAERGKRSVRQLFEYLREICGEEEAGLSAVTLVELAHGIERAKLEIHRLHRQAFLDDLIADIEVFPLTSAIAPASLKETGRADDLVRRSKLFVLGHRVLCFALRTHTPGSDVREYDDWLPISTFGNSPVR